MWERQKAKGLSKEKLSLELFDFLQHDFLVSSPTTVCPHHGQIMPARLRETCIFFRIQLQLFLVEIHVGLMLLTNQEIMLHEILKTELICATPLGLLPFPLLFYRS